MSFVYIEYKHKWASGHEEKPAYKRIETDQLEEGNPPEWLLDEITKRSEWSDKYRGIDYCVVDKPPEEWIKKEVVRANETMSTLIIYIKYLNSL